MARLARWLRHARQLVLQLLMNLSGVPVVGRAALHLAGALVGPYKDRRILAKITSHSYISPASQVHCRKLTLGKSCFVDDRVTIYAHPDGGEVRLGDRVHLYRDTIIEIGAGGSVTIGDDTHIQAGCNLKGFLGSLIIGRNVQLAPRCGFSPYEHNIEDPNTPIQKQGIRSKGPITLDDDVWLGLNVSVLEGVHIGRGAVIGANSVVTKDIPELAIAVGVPAQVIRYRGNP